MVNESVIGNRGCVLRVMGVNKLYSLQGRVKKGGLRLFVEPVIGTFRYSALR